MRLWHYNLIPYLPKSQLIAQWRELNSIFKKQDKHILINYIYDYPRSTLKTYADEVILEMNRRNFKINKWDNYNNYFKYCESDGLHFKEHNGEYLLINYYNLKEKYIRGQKDFSKEKFDELSHDLVYYMT